MITVVQGPPQCRVLARCGSKKQVEEFNHTIGLVSAVGEQTMVPAGNGQPSGSQVENKHPNRGPGGPYIVNMKRRANEGYQGSCYEKKCIRPVNRKGWAGRGRSCRHFAALHA